jgi:hypothetical protein
MSRAAVSTVAVVILLIALWVGDVFATHAIFTSRYPGANDFAGRYAGARVFWVQGSSPYSDEAIRQAQILLHGRTLTPEEIKEGVLDVSLFAYPFYMVFWLAPVAILPYDWAEAVWLATLEFALVGSVIGAISLARWKLPAWLLAITLVWSIFFYHSARAILLGQVAVLIFMLNLTTLLALRARRDVLAGALLAISTTKPQMAFLIVPFIFLWLVVRRRWRAVTAFLVTMSILCGASFILLPSWVGDFLRQVVGYTSYTDIGSPVWIITRRFSPVLGAPAEIGLSLALVLGMLVTWIWLWRDDSWPAFVWTACFTLIITNLIAFRTATTNYVVLFIPLIWMLAAIHRQWKRGGTWGVLALQTILLFGMWVLFLTTLVNKYEHPIVYLPLPILLLLVFVPGRRQLITDLATAQAAVS